MQTTEFNVLPGIGRSPAGFPLLAAAALAFTLGAVSGVSPAAGAGVAILCLYGVAAVWAPTFLVALSLISVAVYAEKVSPGSAVAAPEVQKAFLVACVLPALVHRGVRLVALVPVAGLCVLALASELLGAPLEGLTPSQTASSLLTLSIGWLYVAVAWTRRDAEKLLLSLAGVAVVTVLVGVVYAGLGRFPVIQPGPPPPARLAGASIAAFLGAGAAVGAVASLVLRLVSQGRTQRVLASCLLAVNAVILVGTVSRGAMLFAAVAVIPLGWAAAREGLFSGRRSAAVRLVAMGLLATGVVAVASAAFASRDESSSFDARTQTVRRDSSSGRTEAWREFFEAGRVSPVFGRGVGAGPLVEVGESGFKAQHNEYLRAFVETGFVGTFVTIGVIALVLMRVVGRGAARGLRPTGIAVIAGFAVYSITDNTLSSPYLSVPIFLLLAAISSTADRRDARIPRFGARTSFIASK